MIPRESVPGMLEMNAGPGLPWDLLVIANPVWESAWLLPERPSGDAIDFDPRPSALAVVEDGGGSALNTACALACAGRRVVAVGRVGDDAEGRAAISALERRGITSRIEIAAGRSTKRNHLYVGARDHSVAFRAFLPLGCAPAWEDTPREIALARVLLLDRLAAEAPAWLRARRRPGDAVDLRRPEGVESPGRPRLLNAFNRNSPPFRGPAVERFREALPFLDYLQVSEGTPEPRDEEGAGEPPRDHSMLDPSIAASIHPPDHPLIPDPSIRGVIHSPPDAPPLSADAIAAILGAGVAILARTRGAQGVILHRAGSAAGSLAGSAADFAAGSEPVSIPAIETNVVDSTGAGDAFTAGFLDLLLDGADAVAAARRGMDWGARACRHLGARGWLDREPPEKR